MKKIGNIKDYKSPETRKMAEEKSTEYNSNGRTKEQHIKDIEEGELLVEAVVADHFQMEKYDKHTWADLIKDGKLFEVKMTRRNDKWWNFDEKKYNHFLENHEKVDGIINVFLDKNGDVYLKTIANAKTFPDFVRKSNNGIGSYYNKFEAERQDHCQNF